MKCGTPFFIRRCPQSRRVNLRSTCLPRRRPVRISRRWRARSSLSSMGASSKARRRATAMSRGRTRPPRFSAMWRLTMAAGNWRSRRAAASSMKRASASSCNSPGALRIHGWRPMPPRVLRCVPRRVGRMKSRCTRLAPAMVCPTPARSSMKCPNCMARVWPLAPARWTFCFTARCAALIRSAFSPSAMGRTGPPTRTRSSEACRTPPGRRCA